MRPKIDYGVSAGLSLPRRSSEGAQAGSAIIWAHVDRPARMQVEYSTTPSFRNSIRLRGELALPDTGLTSRAEIRNVPAGQDVFYRVHFEDARDSRIVSALEEGHFRTARATGPVRIAWTADVCGQGWGIDNARGGMRLFATMADANPDLFIHVGDTIYADGPLAEEVPLDDGTVWRNFVTPAKAKVAETLDEYRGNHLYNRLDDHYRRFAAEVGHVVIWDDHEVRDNWFHDQVLPEQLPYTEKRVRVLAERARQAFLENYPITIDRAAGARIYRSIPFGPLVEVFALDMRSYRSANNENLQSALGREAALLGRQQLQWLADALSRSKAAWKIVAADMPLGVTVAHQPGRHEAVANDDHGAARGRELEIASLLSTLKKNRVRNVVWITADVHYCAAHHYDPARAATTDFDPFWEFVAGPAHAGTFAPGPLDGTFGPDLKFSGTPANLKPNRPPDAGLQFFGLLETDHPGRELTVSLMNTAGRRIFTQHLERV
ncbi:MAG TPA: alkaline phosphatase D family protein [Vicinamibacterales bacterium]|nr:alkaline phosphatase D family protein [Vicinamibacterales bacterium]